MPLNPDSVRMELLDNGNYRYRLRQSDSINALEDHLVDALRGLENSLSRVKSITGWDWIINAISSAN